MGDAIETFAVDFADLSGAVRYLISLLPSTKRPPTPVVATVAKPSPTGKLTASKMCAILAALQPEDAIVVDESLTSGQPQAAAPPRHPPHPLPTTM